MCMYYFRVTRFRESVSDEKYSLLPLFDRRNLMLMRFLGSGAFGEVYEGKAHNIVTPDAITLVAVKVRRVVKAKSSPVARVLTIVVVSPGQPTVEIHTP